MKTCKDCRKFGTMECVFRASARETWQGCTFADTKPTEIIMALWWWVGWRRADWSTAANLAKVMNRTEIAAGRLESAISRRSKEATK